MKVCIPSQFPGGPDGLAVAPFEESELLDYYDVKEDGSFEHIAQTRPCQGGCSDPVEAIIRREVKTIIVVGISPSVLMRFRNAGIKILKTKGGKAETAIGDLIAGRLPEIGIEQYSTLGKDKKRG